MYPVIEALALCDEKLWKETGRAINHVRISSDVDVSGLAKSVDGQTLYFRGWPVMVDQRLPPNTVQVAHVGISESFVRTHTL